MTWQQGALFALEVYGIAAVVSMVTAAVLQGTYLVVKRLSRD